MGSVESEEWGIRHSMSENSDIECRIFLASGAVGFRISKCALDPGPHACGVGTSAVQAAHCGLPRAHACDVDSARCVGRGIRWPRASCMRRETDCSGLLRAAWAGRPDSARVGLLIMMRRRTDLEPEVDRSRCGVRPISSRKRTDLGERGGWGTTGAGAAATHRYAPARHRERWEVRRL